MSLEVDRIGKLEIGMKNVEMELKNTNEKLGRIENQAMEQWVAVQSTLRRIEKQLHTDTSAPGEAHKTEEKHTRNASPRVTTLASMSL